MGSFIRTLIVLVCINFCVLPAFSFVTAVEGGQAPGELSGAAFVSGAAGAESAAISRGHDSHVSYQQADFADMITLSLLFVAPAVLIAAYRRRFTRQKAA